jgi:hypothetical protein
LIELACQLPHRPEINLTSGCNPISIELLRLEVALPISRTLRLFAAAAPILAMAVPVSATHQPASDTIIVRGTRINPAEARQRAVEFVKRAGVAKGEKQVARWVVPVCIKIIGLQDSQAEQIAQNMLAIARQGGVDVAGPKCDPNITVAFTTDPKQVVRQIKARRPHQLRELSFADRERVLTGDAPVRWWYATEMLDRDGVHGNNISPGWIGPGEGSSVPGSAVTDPVSVGGVGDMTSTQQYNGGSNVRTPTMRSLYGATVIVDASKIGEAPIEALAAYAAMVAFAEMDASDPPPPDSILGMFQPSSIEISLTDWDMAFLKSLYRMPLDRRSRIQRGHLVEALLDERLPKTPAKKKP